MDQNEVAVHAVCDRAREELATFEDAARRGKAAKGVARKEALAQMRAARAAIGLLLAEAATWARARPPRRTGPVVIPDPVPDVDQDPQD